MINVIHLLINSVRAQNKRLISGYTSFSTLLWIVNVIFVCGNVETPNWLSIVKKISKFFTHLYTVIKMCFIVFPAFHRCSANKYQSHFEIQGLLCLKNTQSYSLCAACLHCVDVRWSYNDLHEVLMSWRWVNEAQRPLCASCCVCLFTGPAQTCSASSHQGQMISSGGGQPDP